MIRAMKETVSRMLAKFKGEGLIDYSRGRITIKILIVLKMCVTAKYDP